MLIGGKQVFQKCGYSFNEFAVTSLALHTHPARECKTDAAFSIAAMQLLQQQACPKPEAHGTQQHTLHLQGRRLLHARNSLDCETLGKTSVSVHRPLVSPGFLHHIPNGCTMRVCVCFVFGCVCVCVCVCACVRYGPCCLNYRFDLI